MSYNSIVIKSSAAWYYDDNNCNLLSIDGWYDYDKYTSGGILYFWNSCAMTKENYQNRCLKSNYTPYNAKTHMKSLKISVKLVKHN